MSIDSTASGERETDRIKRISSILFLFALLLSLSLAIMLSFKSPTFNLVYIVEEYQTSSELAILWKVAFLILLGLSTYESIFGLNRGTKIDLFKRHESKVSNVELFLMGTALSIMSAFIVFVLLMFYGKNFPSSPLGTEENSFTAYYKVAITAPVFEEFLFRFMFLLVPLSIYRLIKRGHGLKHIYGGKKELETSDWIAILLTAIIFGLAHIGWAQWFQGVGGLLAVMLTYWKIAQAMGMGVLLGYSASRYGILASIAIHWAMNSLSSSMTVFFLLFNFRIALFLTSIVLIFILVMIAFGIIVFVNMALR